MPPQVIQEFVGVARQIWWRRNSFIFKETFTHPSTIIKETRHTLELLNEETPRKDLRTCHGYTSTNSWQAPPLNWIKLNWDGATDKAQGLIGVGVVARDSAGHIISTLRTSKHLFPDPLLAEAFGALQAMNFGLELGFTQVIIEGDSLQVVRALKNEKEGWSSASMIMNDTKVLLQKFAKWEVSHVRRN
ncbi:hypothetical protein F2P56_013102, partial [Juglans regia]